MGRRSVTWGAMSSILNLMGLVGVMAFLTLGCSAAAEPTPVPTATLDVGAMVRAAMATALDRTTLPAPTPAATPTPSPTYTRVPTPTPTTVLLSPKPASTQDQRFAAQRTRLAPTVTAQVHQAAKLVDKTGMHHQWRMMTSAATAEQRADNGYAGGQAINDERGQQYTCIVYEYGPQVPRVNLAFGRDLTYTVIINQAGEYQGHVEAVTAVNGVVIPVEWRTWSNRTDRIRLRGADAVRLVRKIAEQRTDRFQLELPDDPDLSATYDVSNLLTALKSNAMTCFED